MFHAIMTFEEEVLLLIQNNLRNDMLTPIFVFITTLGNGGAIWILLSLGLLIPKKTRKIGILSLCALFFSVLIDNVILKNVIGRARPFDMIEGLNCLINKPTDYSFPSGHTGSSFAAAAVMFLGLRKKYSFSAIIFAMLMGFSRLYVGVHYLSDVVGGAVIGTMIGVTVYMIGMNVMNKKWNVDRR